MGDRRVVLRELRRREEGGPADRVPCRLEGGDGEAVGPQVGVRAHQLSVRDPGLPRAPAVRGQEVQARTDVQPRLRDRDADRLGPQHARLRRQRVGVRELGDGPCGPCGALAVVESDEADHAGAHERAVACGLLGPLVEHRGRAREPLGGGARERRRRAEHAGGLRADVARAVSEPRLEGRGDLVELGQARQAAAALTHAGDAHSHLRVVAPLARSIGAEAATAHQRVALGRPRELVGDAERVAARLTQEHSGRAVEHVRVEGVGGHD